VELVEMLGEHWPAGADWEVEDAGDDLEKTFIKLDSSKARHELGWIPRYNLDTTVNLTTRWYWSYFQEEDMETVTLRQLQKFVSPS
jgi:CDP-glucose 4,6-dehydratase